MNIGELRERAEAFEQTLGAKKAALSPRDFSWYPYGTLANFTHLDALLTGEHRSFLDLLDARPIVDIGAADGRAIACSSKG